MEFKKFRFRFRQFGGWRLIRAYGRLGVLPIAIKELWIVVTQRRQLKEAYPSIERRIAPLLKERYTPLLNSLIEKYDSLVLEHKSNNIVWFCWLQGLEKAPDLIKLCLHSLQKNLTNFKIIVINYDNYRNFVTLDPYIEKLHLKGIIPHAHFTDIIRLELLIQNGGTWIDSTVLCTGDNFPRKIMNCDLFFFQYFRKNSNTYLGISNWFISAFSNNKLLLILRDMLLQYWHDYDCLLFYYIFHRFFDMIAKKYPKEIHAMPKGNSKIALQLGQIVNMPYDETKMDFILKHCCFHKLNYRIDKKSMNNPNSFLSHIMNFYS